MGVRKSIKFSINKHLFVCENNDIHISSETDAEEQNEYFVDFWFKKPFRFPKVHVVCMRICVLINRY